MTVSKIITPAGGEVEIDRYHVVKMISEGGGVISYIPHGPEVVPAKAHDAHVTRLQAEVERLNVVYKAYSSKLVVDALKTDNKALQSELTKARELLNRWDSMWNGRGIHNGPLTKLREATKGFLSNQSAPADKG